MCCVVGKLKCERVARTCLSVCTVRVVCRAANINYYRNTADTNVQQELNRR